MQNRFFINTRKPRVFPGFFSQVPETLVLKFYPESEFGNTGAKPQEHQQTENAHPTVRLRSNQKEIQPSANICYNSTNEHLPKLTRGLSFWLQLVLNFTWACWKLFTFWAKKKRICAGKSSLYIHFKCSDTIKACCQYWKCNSSYCQSSWSLKDPAHCISSQTEMVTEDLVQKTSRKAWLWLCRKS